MGYWNDQMLGMCEERKRAVAKLRENKMVALDLARCWGVSSEDAADALAGIVLTDGTLLWADRNRAWRLEHPKTVIGALVECMTENFGPQKHDWISFLG